MLKLQIKLATILYEFIRDMNDPELDTIRGQKVNLIAWLDYILNIFYSWQ